MTEKIHKVLARAGHGSRREVERWIQEGRVKVNGRGAKLGMRVSADDRIQVDGRLVSTSGPRSSTPRVIIYNKPEGEVCTRASDEKRPTVFRNLPPLNQARWISVGRLDLNTSGLMLFTDDGELAHSLMHPSAGLEREYLVRVRGKVDDEVIRILLSGVSLDGRDARFDRITGVGKRGDGQNQWFRVVIREGRYREVRRIWEKAGCQVSRLKRIRYGPIRLPRNLKQGQHVKLAPAQLEKLLRVSGISERSNDGRPGESRRRRKPVDDVDSKVTGKRSARHRHG